MGTLDIFVKMSEVDDYKILMLFLSHIDTYINYDPLLKVERKHSHWSLLKMS